MTYYEKYQTLVDEITTKAINGVVPASCFVGIQNDIKKSFQEWKSKTSVTMANKEVKTVVHEFK